MKIILPTAGKGTRLRPHTHTRAKSLVRVAGKTVLEHIVARLAPLQAEEYIFINDEDNGPQVMEFMASKFPHLKTWATVQQQRLGPAHAVSLAAARIEPGDEVLIVFNDTIFVTDLRRIPELCAGCDGLIYSKEVEDFQRFGVNVITDGLISDMVEKPDTPVSRLAQVGLYYLRDGRDFMDYLQRTISAGETVKGEYYLPAVFMNMIRDGRRLKAPEIDAWLDCGKPETLLETNRYLLRGRHHIHGEAHDCILLEPVHIEAGAVARHSIIGPNVSVAAGSIIDNSIVRDSIINADNRVSNMILESSILGDAVQLSGAARRMNIGDHSLIEMQG